MNSTRECVGACLKILKSGCVVFYQPQPLLKLAKGKIHIALLVLPIFGLAGCGTIKGGGKNSLGNWPSNAEPARIGKLLAENFEKHRFDFEKNPKREFVIYPEIISEFGALEIARLEGDSHLQGRLINKFDRFWSPGDARRISQRRHVDYELFGAVPLEIFQINHERKYLEAGIAYADRQWSQTTPDGITDEARYWIDDMYMITALEVQAWRASGDAKYIDRAAQTMVAYLDRLQQPNGLFHHGVDSPFFWGRGNGWVAAGMTLLLESMPEKHPERPRILAGYRKMMTALLAHQGKDGLWRQLVDEDTAWPETSGSSMFAFAMVQGVKSGWLEPATYGPAARKAWIGLVDELDPDGNLREVCIGTDKGKTREYYLNRPRETGNLHGQAPMMWTAAALLK
jgi:rhamnogalacturonyl hydrolase YesR